MARYMGAEWAANPGSSRLDYYDDIAWYYGIDDDELVRAFNAGAAAERKANGR